MLSIRGSLVTFVMTHQGARSFLPFASNGIFSCFCHLDVFEPSMTAVCTHALSAWRTSVLLHSTPPHMLYPLQSFAHLSLPSSLTSCLSCRTRLLCHDITYGCAFNIYMYNIWCAFILAIVCHDEYDTRTCNCHFIELKFTCLCLFRRK